MVNNCAAALALVATALGAGPRAGAGPRRAGRDRRRLPHPRPARSPPAPGCARSGRRTGSPSPTTAAPSARTPARCSRCTRRTSSSAASPGRSRWRELAAALAGTGIPLVADVGSGLLRPHPLLPDEPDLQSTLAAGADLVLASGDKLLGGPQAGLVLGRAELVQRLRRHPLYRALRVDKTTLAALEATLRGPLPPVQEMLAADLDGLRARAARAGRPARRGGHRRRRRRRGGAGRRGRGARSTRCPAPPSRCPASFAEPLRRGHAAGGRLRGGRPHAAEPAQPAAVGRRRPRRGRAGGRRPVTGMDVIATAGHVDHGKSALVRALTGMEPDRWAEERRRGLTIDLGFAWTTLPSGRRLAVVDVPGPRAVRRQHARRGRVGARGAAGGRGRRRLVGADRRARRRPRRPRRPARAARGDQGRPRRSRRRCSPTSASGCAATSMGDVPGGRGQRR